MFTSNLLPPRDRNVKAGLQLTATKPDPRAELAGLCEGQTPDVLACLTAQVANEIGSQQDADRRPLTSWAHDVTGEWFLGGMQTGARETVRGALCGMSGATESFVAQA